MNVTLTNLGAEALPLTSSQGGGVALSLKPGEPYSFADQTVTIATIGDNPDFLEDLQDALSSIAKKAIELILFWREHASRPKDSDTPLVRVRVVAGPTNAIRCTGDDKSLDVEIGGGATVDVVMPRYVELRQLGVGGAASQPEAP
ncbi:hypothetical protein GCM10028796_46650 [Ramlibacter monticola]|uniref:Uncharacterized protein n=1 Tax=Ramlibacter monticola TaxID=1926872 RepID=A0A937CV45_9BURK|nr:hypothetical protein [Ramlibacter monticola]MBL0394290.1 hypothetical protein [Ramlibacter monticola]